MDQIEIPQFSPLSFFLIILLWPVISYIFFYIEKIYNQRLLIYPNKQSMSIELNYDLSAKTESKNENPREIDT
jgi:hypothetical protein